MNDKEMLEYKIQVLCDTCDINDEECCSTCVFGLAKQVLDINDRQKAEIERLHKEVDRLSQCVMYHDGQVVDAIKEFAEKFKEKAGSIVTSCQGYEIYETKQYQISAINFDNLVKEMVGENDV